MKLHTLRQDGTDRGAAPVIGIILMVAVAVILAAVVGTFALGEGDQSEPVPQAAFEYDFNGSYGVTVTHTSGDAIERSTLSISANGSTYNATNWGDDDAVETGDQLVISETTVDEDGTQNTFTRGDVVRVIWENPAGGESNTISQREWA